MCGICGIFFPEQDVAVLARNVAKMTQRLCHRGPDGEGIFTAPGVTFGHRRLSIIDLGGGKQPMVDDRGFIITFNGEIYNFREIRRELEAQGETFATASDTEVLLKAYILWGDHCLEKLNGMFAFAIMDQPQGRVFLARDRLGIKPLYYSIIPEGIVFASEIPALLTSQLVNQDIDLSYMPFYLANFYFPGEHTPFKNIKKLLPGHTLSVSQGNIRLTRYWDIEEKYRRSGAHRATRTDEAELQHLIQDAVHMQTVADVPIGTLLSGGIDSGIVTSIVATYLPTPVKTFTVSFSNVSDFDEAPLARQVAKLYGTEHYEIHLTEQDLIEHHEKLLSQFGQPFADSSALPTYLISRFAREQVKVVLSGDGGDEQFGGYGNYQRYLQIRRIDLLRRWRPTRELVTSLASIASSLVGIWRPYVSERMRFYAKVLRQEAAFMFQDLTSIIDMAGMSHLAGERLQPFVDWDFFRRLYERDPDLHLDGVMLHDLKHFLVDDVLQKVDIMSMAVSLEVRVPLLDHRVVEKAVQISWKDKLSFSTTKRILRRLYRSKLPEAVLQAPKKGFSIPIDKWFRGPLRTEAQDLLLGKSCVKRGILNPTAVKVLLDDHQSGAANNGHRIWTLMALEKWFRQVEGT